MSVVDVVAEASAGRLASGRPSHPLARLGDLITGAVAVVDVIRSVSFGQYAEDVMLATSLLPKSRGFYVDVGAYHPWKGSNTYKLYLRGWSGLTIEPNPSAEARFRRWRRRDKHLVMGVARTEEVLTYYEFTDPKRNTFSKEQAEVYVAENDVLTGSRTVPCRPLQAVLDEHAPGQAIDLLSVDCEGFDLAALSSLDLGRTRPTAILVEDFEGFQLRRRGMGHSPIEALLLDKGYEFISQNLFSSLFVDAAAIRRQRPSSAYHSNAWQFR
jgi:FkbM family methyltransferase